jgi:hypothetical protein
MHAGDRCFGLTKRDGRVYGCDCLGHHDHSRNGTWVSIINGAITYTYPDGCQQSTIVHDDDDTYPFESDTAWRETAERCVCGEPLFGEIAEVVRDGEHVVVHVGCMLPDEQVA